MSKRPEGDLWVFAYGSLMWNPLLRFAQRSAAVLHGWHRSFCLHIVAGRATPTEPGRMLALEEGGFTRGMAFRLHEDSINEELRLVWIREMVMGSYMPIWAPVALADGTQANAIAFVANPAGPQFKPHSSIAAIAQQIARAKGSFGSNADYVHQLKAALDEMGTHDEYVHSLATELALQASFPQTI
jgi:cation transport protein ChaC